MRKPTFEGASRLMDRLAHHATEWTGSTVAFLGALMLTVLWLVTGPLFHFSDTWQLMMNTVSSIVTFLMVFLIQRSQNKDTLAMQIKLNELIAAQQGASSRLINVEELSEQEVLALHQRYQQLSDKLRNSPDAAQKSSIEQVEGPQAPARRHKGC